MMSTLGNIIWFVFGGVFIFIHYLIAGFLICLTIVGIPFGIQIFKLARLSLWPFEKEIITKEQGSGCLPTFMNVLWILLGGIWIALHHLVWAILLGLTIIGIPFAAQHIKLTHLALFPFGKEIR